MEFSKNLYPNKSICIEEWKKNDPHSKFLPGDPVYVYIVGTRRIIQATIIAENSCFVNGTNYNIDPVDPSCKLRSSATIWMYLVPTHNMDFSSGI